MKNILIVGAGVAGTDVLREIKKSPDLGIKVVGFVDDNKGLIGKKINGVSVLGTGRKLRSLIVEHKIDEVIIAIPSASGERISKYVKLCIELKIAFRIVPRVREIIEGRARVDTLRKARIEDLLGRPVVKADVEKLKIFFRSKSVMITGAAGSIGSELSEQICAYHPKSVCFLDWWEGGIFELEQRLRRFFPKQKMEFVISDIKNRKKIKKVMGKYMPDYLFHAAAYKHVPAMEKYPEEAVLNNIFGTQVLAEEASNASVSKFILISTDKAANPSSIMGASKLLAESIVGNIYSQTKYIVVRFGNVLGSSGSVVPIFEKQIRSGGPVTVTDKRMTRFFMTIPEASQLTLKAAQMGIGGELYVLDMGKPMKILDLAEDIIRLFGYVPHVDIKIKFSGIRPGEKLNEKLFSNEENMSRSKDPRIFIGKNIVGKKVAKAQIENLYSLARDGQLSKLKNEIINICPGFRKKSR